MNNLARNLENMPLRVALYIRVSTDEQAIKGLSRSTARGPYATCQRTRMDHCRYLCGCC